MNLASTQCDCPDPVGSTSSGVTVEWDHSVQDPSIDRALFVFTEVASQQATSVEIRRSIHTCVALALGVYRVTAFAKGLETYRDVVELRSSTPTRLAPRLTEGSTKTKTFESVLERLQIVGPIDTPDLEVPRNTRVVLDSSNAKFVNHWRPVILSDASIAKKAFGNSDSLFSGGLPRYAMSTSSGASRDELVRAAAREYVFGSSEHAKAWLSDINSAVFDESMALSAFLLGTVTINAGGVLEVGTKSHLLICRKLRMHVASTLLVRGQGPALVEPLAIETFC